MARTYTRYIIRHLLGPALFITLSLTGILWLAQSLRFVDLIVNRGLSILTFLYLTVLLMPSLLSIVLPVALFCAVLYVYNKLLSDSELIVLESAGLSKRQLAWPALVLGGFFCIVGYVNSLYLLPSSYREFKDLQFFIRNNYASLLLQEGVFNTPVDGMTVFLRRREDNGVLRGIMVHDNRDQARPVTMMAETGRLVQTPSGPRFILEQGNRQEINTDQQQLSLLHFDRYTLDISLYTEDAGERWREPKERYLHELFYPDDTTKPHQLNKLRAEAHQRLTWPLFSLSLTVLGLAALLRGEFNRRGIWRRIVLAGALAIGLVTSVVATSNLVVRQPLLSPLLYSLIIGAGLIALWTLRERTHSLPPRGPATTEPNQAG